MPVIAVFTKYDQFKHNVEMMLEDDGHPDPISQAGIKAEEMFQKLYVEELGGTLKFLRLERMHKVGEGCLRLIGMTADALDHRVLTLMLLAVQRGNVEMSIRVAVKRACDILHGGGQDVRKIVQKCMEPFPYIWLWNYDDDYDDDDHDDDDYYLDFNLDLRDFEDFYFDYYFKDDDVVKTLDLLMLCIEHAALHENNYHIMIMIILILEHATLLCFLGVHPLDALHQGHQQYMLCSTHVAVAKQFTAPFEESAIQEVVDFILHSRLSFSNTIIPQGVENG